MCLACQHFDFNSADWISDNLHVISSRYLQTMGKEFIFQFSRHSWGRNAWRVGGYSDTCTLEKPKKLKSLLKGYLGARKSLNKTLKKSKKISA